MCAEPPTRAWSENRQSFGDPLLLTSACDPLVNPPELEFAPMSRPFDLDQVRVVGRGAARRCAVVGQDIGTAAGIDAVTVGCEPGAFLDRDDAGRDARRDLDRQKG